MEALSNSGAKRREFKKTIKVGIMKICGVPDSRYIKNRKWHPISQPFFGFLVVSGIRHSVQLKQRDKKEQ